ncbi:MAG TPA: FlgD immunoglobulin-like domain containing protein, partial [bacterium]|nr:FlgD immunoglobulin-like domain containing protein [bacterium]
METSGLDFTLKAGTTQNKWDVVAIGSNVYSFCEVEITKFTWDGFGWGYTKLSPMAGGAPVQSTQVVDLNGDGVQEMIVAVYDWGNDAAKGIYLVQEDGDTLKHTELVNVGKWWPSGTRGPWGGASGDIDGDGKLDFVYGSRASTPNAGIFHLAYKGGDIANPANYTFAVIDSLYSEGGIWTVVQLANVDSDPQMEVLYTSSTDAGVFPDLGTKPIVVLDYVPTTLAFDNLIVAPEVLYNGATPPTSFIFKPGRILDNGQTIWFCGHNSSTKETFVWRSIDGGNTFTHNATAIPNRTAGMDAFDANIAIVAQADGKIHRTTDGGITWTEVHAYTIPPIAPGWFDGVKVLGENVAVAFGDGDSNGNMYFCRTEDKGATWNEIIGIDYLQASQAIYSWGLASCSLGPNMWATGTASDNNGSFVFRSKDAGLTWESFTVPTEIIAKDIRAITFLDGNKGMCNGRSGNIFATTDGGATWSAVSKPDTASDCWVNGVVAIPNTNIVMGMDDIGVWYTSDLGATWGKVNISPTVPDDDFVGGLFLSKNFGYVFSYAGQVLRFENMLTGIADRPRESMPEGFQLSQNYPNPFNPTTTISYTLPVKQTVSLVIYNLKGEVVKTLAEGTMNEGNHSVNWDATNNNGQKVTSGIYIYLLRSGNHQIARQMVLVK